MGRHSVSVPLAAMAGLAFALAYPLALSRDDGRQDQGGNRAEPEFGKDGQAMTYQAKQVSAALKYMEKQS